MKTKFIPLLAAIALPIFSPSVSAQFCDEDEFLGVLSANPYLADSTSNEFGEFGSPYESDSISNPFGKFGSPYSPTSINNPYSQYGSQFSPISPNNPYATKPPILCE